MHSYIAQHTVILYVDPALRGTMCIRQ